MRLIIIGEISSELITASKIAMEKGCKVKHSANIEDALSNIFEGSGADIALIDVKCNIEDFIKRLRANCSNMPVIACGVEVSAEIASNSIKLGASEFLPLPPDKELIAAIIETITKNDKKFIYSSPKMHEIAKLALQIAPSNAGILITGMSGTGKEVIARFIHENSQRKNNNFISVNCAAIPENLIESELFGHEKGAFTGALLKRIGKFEEANNGTILLDEISEIDIKLQAKLLRVLQEHEINRIGSNKNLKLNIRVIATSNRDLKEEVRHGNFREDLFFRLNVINIHLPPLNERPEDIMPLCNFYIEKYANISNITLPNLSNEAIKLINEYDWPGNVRELENTMYRAVLLSKDGIITPENLMLNIRKNDNKNINDNSFNAEKKYLTSTLGFCLGDQAKAAEILGISIKKLQEKLEEYKKEYL